MATGSDGISLPAFAQRLFPPFAGLPLGPLLTASLRSLALPRPALVAARVPGRPLGRDAAFFHRTISVSGRTEAVVALRNAIEDAELRPSDLLGLRGTLARFADAGILGGLGAVRHLAASAPGREGDRA